MVTIIGSNDLSILKLLKMQDRKVTREAISKYLKMHETSLHFSITRLNKLKLIDIEEDSGTGAPQIIGINRNGEKVLNGLGEI